MSDTPKSLKTADSVEDAHGIISPFAKQPDQRELRRALLKLDTCLLPVATLIYFLNFLDRSNIGNAKAAGLQKDLGLTSMQYSICLTVTYVPYIVAELPLTLLMKKIGPHILLPTLVCLWGIVTLFQGFVHSYHGLIVARFFLGAVEGAILPGLVTYLSNFYPRRVIGKRLAVFFSAISLAGAFSGLLAAAILNMEGVAGRRGWSWLFILEGLATVVIGACCYFVLPRDPISARYLTAAQRQALLEAMDEPAEHGDFKLKYMLDAIKSPQMWAIFICLFANGVTIYSLAYFSPTIVSGLGWSGISAQLHTVPPYAVSTAVSITACYFSDRVAHRGAFIVVGSLVSIAGYAVFLASKDHKVLYGSLFLQVIGAYTVCPLLSSWQSNNLAPHYKRATGVAFIFIASNSGGILSTWLFPTTEAPRYKRATWIALGLTLLLMVVSIFNSMYLARENRKKRSGQVVEGEGDKSPHFHYIT